jgi:hypothetical protein
MALRKEVASGVARGEPWPCGELRPWPPLWDVSRVALEGPGPLP